MTADLEDTKRLLVGHGALLIFIGGVLGFGFLFFLMERVALWPFPFSIDVQLPGTYDAWRMAHMEGIVNGFGLWIAAAVLPVFPFGVKALKRIAWGLISVGWTIVIASALDPLFPDSRGLEFGGSATNQLAFFLFYWGVVLVMIIMGVIAWRCLRPHKQPD
ncbi:hypothetical protein ATO7_10437 [Oceanococcus atlanticus]|uniref:Uncharacterized protein n=1 Tax=Oceanococcus atlanticus TaxID=1317117 RepID=A0A1Y1SFI5_9GAMM|nr:hypothetical protein [Oceanococcus atlanticus]ORE87453.1 hypothetical protein ATO7_10437 [Oceanococcus atlanticus]RZO87197.1 MAG: hypothetical protein EVA65_02710 [Oceanococcus sp.]